ncbi:helix-turn-helix transcriptional regulator [Virgibacillus sp. YIM 98842]|uniref:helix-turn-helix domain-containing protein n=1 Tax=Virgibacillus sp. YIM 98842 TaxID=2663533 RepID=UPI0013D970B7|nr:helix-turn-helix transcriptional regulator [Virgibacillus sp. YIM 98842]
MEKKNDVFGKRLKELRNNKGEKQEQTADSIGISRARYSHYENNHVEPDMDLIRKFADYFRVDTDYLLGRTNTPRKNNNDESDSLAEIKKIVEDYGIEDIFFHNIEDWKNLTDEDIKEIKNHFKYITHKAKERKAKRGD